VQDLNISAHGISSPELNFSLFCLYPPSDSKTAQLPSIVGVNRYQLTTFPPPASLAHHAFELAGLSLPGMFQAVATLGTTDAPKCFAKNQRKFQQLDN
jgi:hypothetical protein